MRLGSGLLVLIAVGLASGCASVRYDANYQSAIRHEVLPLRTTVTVLVSPELQEDMEDEPEKLEAVRRSYQDALRRDLRDNGPLTPVAENPEARLQVTLGKIRRSEIPLVAIWFLAPTWLFGVPIYYGRVQLALDVQLTSAWGDVLYRTKINGTCSRVQGLYYGHQDLTYGCPGQKIAEKLRQTLSLNRSDVLAAQARSRAVVQASVPPPPPSIAKPKPRVTVPPKPNGPAPIAAVFNIRDMSQQFEPLVLDQLTEYLSAQISSQLRFKIVPREEIRQRIEDAKVESYRACYDESCQIEVGKALAATKSVSTVLIRVGNRCAFTSTVYDLRTEAADRAASVQTSCDEDALLDGVEKVVKALHERSR